MVIAGIHQYGTWIAADFFDRLCRDKSVNYKSVLTGDLDFVAIVWGSFDTRNLRVLDTDVEQNFVWTFENEVWSQVSASDK